MAPPVLRAIVGLSCAGSALSAAAAPRKCPGGGAACRAEEALDGISALQMGREHGRAVEREHEAVARSNTTVHRTRSTAERGVPFLGYGRGVELDDMTGGALYIEEDGVKNKYYLPGATIEDNGMTVKYSPPYRFYLMKEPTTDYSDASKFYKPLLVGKTFTVDMKLEDVGCGCNVNFYLVDMPVANPGKDRDHYCDAQCFDGLGCCAEFDMNEGNNAVQQITNHACTGDYAGHGDWHCHKWGEPEAKVSPWEFSGRRGGGQTIDGNKPFTFSQEFRMQGDQLVVITTMTQGAAKVVKTMGPNSQLQAMMHHGSLLRGMAFVTGYWSAQDMNWLDGETCGSGPEHCSGAPAYISNWRITTNSAAPPAPAPPQPQPQPQPSGNAEYRCCYGNAASCKAVGDWCNERADHCTGNCRGQWTKVEHKCCYGGGHNCKENGNWCNERSDHCTGQCRGEWTMMLR